jgi:hypothetical protein
MGSKDSGRTRRFPVLEVIDMTTGPRAHYADQTEADHAKLVRAVRQGAMPATEDALDRAGTAFRP